jgi:5-methyltetrahydrofolate--homocysteine methyltransferase
VKKRFVFNSTPLKPRRKQLRNRATETEKILWSCIKNDGLGYKFIRQYSIEGYVVDFYCPEKRLAVELDGEIHLKTDQKKYDVYRTRLLGAYKIKLIRFWNWEVKSQLTRVLKQIKLALPSYGEATTEGRI